MISQTVPSMLSIPAAGEELVERRLARLRLVAGGERGPDPFQQR